MSRDSEKKDNVFTLNDAASIDSLVRHMRLIRDSIPVNQRLRRELKARLMEGRGSVTESPAPAIPDRITSGGNRGILRWVAGSFLALLLLAAALAVFRASGEKTLEAGPSAEMARFWAEDSPLAPAVSPPGDLIVVERGGALMLLNRQGSRFGTVRPPRGEKYSSPALSPDGRKLAVVRTGASGSEVIALDIPAGAKPGDIQRVIEEGMDRAPALAGRPAGPVYTGLAWSPDGSTLACSVLENGKSMLLLIKGNEELSLGHGGRPAWSPDGSRLVVEREEGEGKALWLVNREGGAEQPLGEGRFPVWNKNGYLLFVKTSIQEKILSYLPDGSPQFSVQRKAGEIRWIHLGAGTGAEMRLSLPDGTPAGSRLLMTPGAPAGPEELQWLKNLELSGVREPRTLYLDRSGDCEGLAAGDGVSLFLSRRDGGTVILTRVGLVENVVKREDTLR